MDKSALLKWLPLLVLLGTGLIAWGSVGARVDTVEKQVVGITAERVTRVEQDVEKVNGGLHYTQGQLSEHLIDSATTNATLKKIAEDVKEIKNDIKELRRGSK